MLARTHLPLCGSTASPGEHHGVGARGVAGADHRAGVAGVGHADQHRDQPRVAGEGLVQAHGDGGAHRDDALGRDGVGEGGGGLVGDAGDPHAGGLRPVAQLRVAVGHGVGEEEVVHMPGAALGPGQRVPHRAHALDEETPGLETRRAPQQLAGCYDARRAFGEELAQAASSFFASLSDGTAARATSTSAVNAAGSEMAISERFLRSTSTPASLRPCMNRL